MIPETRSAMAKGRFEIDPMGPYSLASSVRFLEGFAPASYEGGGADHLRLAFVADGFAERGERAAGAYVYSEGDRVVGGRPVSFLLAVRGGGLGAHKPPHPHRARHDPTSSGSENSLYTPRRRCSTLASA